MDYSIFQLHILFKNGSIPTTVLENVNTSKYSSRSIQTPRKTERSHASIFPYWGVKPKPINSIKIAINEIKKI